jgi:hypothetical protein
MRYLLESIATVEMKRISVVHSRAANENGIVKRQYCHKGMYRDLVNGGYASPLLRSKYF